MPDIQRALGRALRRAREERGLTLRELAQRSGVRPSSIGGYERGERAISVPRFVLLADAMGTTPERVLGVALAQQRDRRAYSVNLSKLGEDPAARSVASHAHRVRSWRGDYVSNVITFRAGDVDMIAYETGRPPKKLIRSLGDSLRAVEPEAKPHETS
jgi:transcriptional regulator with XRE-family HTH domain